MVADFEDNLLPSSGYYNGSGGSGGFTSHGARFNNSYDSTYHSWSGFAYSAVNDTTTAGYGNQYAAITGTGVGGAGTYGVGFDPGAYGAAPIITLPFVAPVQGVYITSATYPFLAVRDGNDGFGAVRQFGDDPALSGDGNQGYPDWFKITATGKDAAGQTTGSDDFFLADYRFASNADDYVVSDWRWFDLSGLGDVKTLTFALSSSDVGQWGVNTPLFFALDNFTFVPEPASLSVLGAVVACATRRGSRRTN